MGVFLLQGEHRRGQGVHRPGQSVARAPSTGGRLLEIRARDELYRKTSDRRSGVSPLRIEGPPPGAQMFHAASQPVPANQEFGVQLPASVKGDATLVFSLRLRECRAVVIRSGSVKALARAFSGH